MLCQETKFSAKLPIGTIITKNHYSAKSDIAYRKWKKHFPELVCFCNVSIYETWVIEEYLTNTLVLVASLKNNKRISIIELQDIAPITPIKD
jgi:hypothetical protein